MLSAFSGQETFFPIHLSLRTNTTCILLVRTTKLLVQKLATTTILKGDIETSYFILDRRIKTNRTPQIEKTYLLVIQHTSDKWSSTFCLFLLDKQPNRTLSAMLVETFLCASFHTFSCYLRFFSFWNEHHC